MAKPAGDPRLTLVVLSLALSGCSSPTSPSIANVQGFYHGSYTEETCSASVNSSLCIGVLQNGSFNLRLTQSDRALHAFIGVCESEINDVTGTLEADGTITLSGQGAVPFNAPLTLSSFRATVIGNSMTGTFACTLGSTPDTMSFTGSLKDVTLISRDPNTPF